MSPSIKRSIISKWLTIVQEYEQVKAKRSQHFKTVKALLSAYHITKRDLYKYHRRWIESGKDPESLLPQKRGPRIRTRRTPKPLERHIIKAHRNLGITSYEMVLLFKPYYGTQTPSARTIDRIKKRYPLNPAQKKRIKRYEKRYPGELGHLDAYYLPLGLGRPRHYLLSLLDDCTRLSYAEVLSSLKAQAVSYFVFRALSWFKQAYGFHFDAVMTDNGAEFKGTPEHPLEYLLSQLKIEHWYTPPQHPQPNGKVEAWFKIAQNEFILPHHFSDIQDFKLRLGEFIIDYNHARHHGGIDYLTPFEKFQKVSELLT